MKTHTRGIISIWDTETVCANCKHFWQHYVYDDRHREFKAIRVGHCAYPRMKDRCVTETCKHFE